MSITSVYCIQGNHIVERDQISWVYSDDGKSRRRICSTCKNTLIDARNERKKTVAKSSGLTTIKLTLA